MRHRPGSRQRARQRAESRGPRFAGLRFAAEQAAAIGTARRRSARGGSDNASATRLSLRISFFEQRDPFARYAAFMRTEESTLEVDFQTPSGVGGQRLAPNADDDMTALVNAIASSYPWGALDMFGQRRVYLVPPTGRP